MISDRLFHRNAPGLRGALWVLALSLSGAWLAVQGAAQWRATERATERTRLVQQTAESLLAQTTGGAMLGAVSLMGLSEPLLKDMALGVLAPDNPEALARLAVARGRFLVSGVFVMSADGTVVAHETSGRRATGDDLSFRPYFQQGMRGVTSVYAAIGKNTQERGLYYAAPLYESDTPSSAIIGVVMFKVGFEAFDLLLRRAPLPMLLLSPQGVVFSSAREEWQYAIAPPLTQARIDAIQASRQFGRHFENGVASALPFALDAERVVLDGTRYAVERQEIDWNDPGGKWQLVALDDISALMTPAQRLQVGAAAFALLSLVGVLLLALLRTRASMATSVERLRVLGTALENSPVSVVITDADGRIEWVNSQFERNTGYRLAEVQGTKPSRVSSGQTPAQTYQDMWATLLSGQSWRGQFINRRKDGTIYHDEATLSPVFDAQGRRIAIVGRHEDVTERIRVQRELERRERLLNELLEQQTAIFDNAPPIALVCDGVFRQFNPAFVDLMGGTASQLLGQGVALLFGSARQSDAFVARVVPALASGQTLREQAELRRLDGSLFTARLAGRGLHMDGVTHASIWVIEDITEARQAEIAMRETRERLELAQEAGKVGVFDVDLTTGHTVWSDRLVTMLGFPPGKQPGSREEWLNSVHPEDRDRVRDHVDACVQGTAQSVRHSWRIVRPDGKVRWCLEAARIFRDDQGRAVRLVGVNVDIHDQKELEARVAQQLSFQQALIDAIPVPLFYKDAQGRYLGFNQAYEQAFGVQRANLIGKTVQDLDFLPQEARTRFGADAEVALRGDQFVHKEVDLPYADGAIHHTLFWLHGFNGPDGQPGGAIGTFVDISDRHGPSRSCGAPRSWPRSPPRSSPASWPT